MRSLLIGVVLAGCTGPGLDHGDDRLEHLVSDGQHVYYVRDSVIVRDDGTVIGHDAEHTRSLAVDGADLYAVSDGGTLDRYSTAGGHHERLVDPDPTWFDDTRFGLDGQNAYFLGVDTYCPDPLSLDCTSSSLAWTVAKPSGDVIANQVVARHLTGDGMHAYGERGASPREIVELDAGGYTDVMPMPDQAFDLEALAGSLYVVGYDGLARVDAGTLTRIFDVAPDAIASDGSTLLGVFDSDDRSDGCRIVEAGSERCVYAGDANEVAIANGLLYFTYYDSDDRQFVLDRLAL